MDKSKNKGKCSFSGTLVTSQFACEKAELITRRDGPAVACLSEQASHDCISLYEQLKQRALPKLGYKDDLLTMPASVLQKVQFGGLLGLQQLLGNDKDSESVSNIFELVNSALSRFGSIDDIPYDSCVSKIVTFKLKKRRRPR